MQSKLYKIASLKRNKNLRAPNRPAHDLEKLRIKILNALFKKFCEKGGRDFFFKSKNLDGYLDVERYTPFLVSRIIKKELTPFPVKLYNSRGKELVFKTNFTNGGKKDE